MKRLGIFCIWWSGRVIKKNNDWPALTTQLLQTLIRVLTSSNDITFHCQKKLILLKGQMHHHDDLGSKCAYMCHLSNKTTRKSVLLSTPQIWLMKVSKKTSLSLGIEAAIIRSGAYEVTVSPASDWLRDISGSH